VVRVGEAAKLVLVGDVRQIASPAAGRPFALLQEASMPTVRLAENRRQQNDTLREAASLAREGRISDTVALLGERVCESADPAAAAVAQYLGLPPGERDRTALLTSGHVLREAVLGAVRDGLIAEGLLGPDVVTLRVWDNLNLTREELRQPRQWAEGMRLDIYRHQAGLAPGTYTVGATEWATGIVRLDRDGHTRYFDPRSLHHAGQGAALAVPGEIEVREGDRLIFTGEDKTRGMTNGTAVTLDRLEGGMLHLSGRGRDYVIAPDDPMRERLGHGAVLNMHRAQGITVDRAITVMDSHDRLLNSQSLYYVLQTRAREDMTLHTDDRVALVAAIESHRGDVPHALHLAPELSPSGGERFDPATGELAPAGIVLESAESRDACLLDAMSAALQAIGKDEVIMAPVMPVPEPVAVARGEPIEPSRKELEIEITRDFDMDM